MQRAMTAVLPAFILIIFLCGAIKKVNLYDSFAAGAKRAFPLILSVFPYLAAIFVMTALMEASGLSDLLVKICSPALEFFGIPEKLCKLVLLKPFSGSGSLALLSEIFSEYGTESYLARCAACIYGSSETTFYVTAVYFSNVKNKKLFKPILISLIASLCSCVFACFICKII